MNILIAEDDPISRRLLVANLEKWDHHITVTVNGLDALEKYAGDEHIDMAILDWMMPGRDGIDVCREIKSISPDRFTYVIMLTAMSETADLALALEAGADDYVIKPFSKVVLKARILAGQRIITLQQSLKDKITELQEALAHVKELQGILPICAWCKKIRDDSDYWQSVEDYVSQHTEARFSHSICPECAEKQLAEFNQGILVAGK